MDISVALKLVRQNLNEIPVTGIENQSRLVGCAKLLDNVISAIEESQNAKPEKKEAAADGK